MSAATELQQPATSIDEQETIPVFAGWIGSWRLSLRRRAFSAQQLRRRYDQAAPGWGRSLARLGVPAAYQALLQRVLPEAGSPLPGRPLRVLDCGTGTGALSCALARVCPGPIALEAIDLSPDMLHRAASRFAASDLDATLYHGDVRALPQNRDSFDLVLSGHVLEHLADPRAALREMTRVLAPGGLLLICMTRRSLAGLLVHLKWRTHRVTPTELETWLRDAGLEAVKTLPYGRSGLCRQLSLACLGRKPFDTYAAEDRDAGSAA